MKNSSLDDDISLPSRFENDLFKSEGKPFAFDHGDLRTLHFDEKFIQSAMRISAPDRLLLTYTQAMMAFLLFNPEPRHILMIGLGGGSLAKYCYRALPATRITVLELDADVINLRHKFLIPDDDERFQIMHTDAVDYLAAMDHQVDIILHDGFSADGLAPSLSTEAFYRRCRSVLEHDGVLVSNLWGDAADLVPVMQRLHAVFDDRLWWTGASGSFNRIVYAAKNIDEAMFRSSLSKRTMQLDLRHSFSFSDLADRLQTAYGKSRADFEQAAGNDMRTAFLQGVTSAA
ncbi:fused MFS/spermidine synthase [Herminiimonas sp. CN]|uniref:fused MFS/spermidine synthase n=1 Tax=Herminiimonas sp. CN TaxID=1349818 RepID=UPI00047402EF|nr:fused MFS/spermidine synthase [Herminiimonas sp. CN]